MTDWQLNNRLSDISFRAATIALVLALIWGTLISQGIIANNKLDKANCIAMAQAKYPVAYQQPTEKTETQFGIGPQPHFVFYNKAKLEEALEEC